jgi:hypothetical protein
MVYFYATMESVMNLGDYNDLKRGLKKVFGRDCYTDDNMVVYVDGDQKSVATLWAVRPNCIAIYRPRRPVVEIQVAGAGMEPSDLRDMPKPVKKLLKQ